MQLRKEGRGFTLIELLVVIAIIGILSSIVLVALRGARNKAKDARIISDMAQLRSLAEMLYDAAAGDYQAFGTSNADVLTLTTDITNQGGTWVILTGGVGNDDYCAYSSLNEGGFFCIDSTGIAKEVTAMGTNCAGTVYTCP